MKNLNTVSITSTNTLISATVLALALITSPSMADPMRGSSQGKGMQGHEMQGQGILGHSGANGEPGKKSQVNRTIKVEMHDNFYKPEKFSIKEGETIRFVVANKGRLVHEFNVATRKQHMGHQKEMMMMVDHGVLEPDKINRDKMMMKMPNGETMEHNDPNSVLLEPGKTGEVIWKFSKKGGLEIGCNVPGHYDAGMVSTVTFK